MGQVRGGDVGPSFIDVTVGASRRSRFRPRAVQEEHVVATLPENGRARIVKKTFRRQVMVRRAILVFDHFFSVLEQARPLRGMVCCERLPVTFNCTVNFSDDFWIFGGNVASFSYVGGGFLFQHVRRRPARSQTTGRRGQYGTSRVGDATTDLFDHKLRGIVDIFDGVKKTVK